MENTLYLSDLDGTLLNRSQQITPYTAQTLRQCIARGAAFSFATARSAATAVPLTRSIGLTLPVITYNGGVILRPDTAEILHACTFTAAQVRLLRGALRETKVQPVVYAFYNGSEKFHYLPQSINRPTREFLDTRRGDGRDAPVDSEEALFGGTPFHISCIGGTQLPALEKLLQKEFYCVRQTDIYSGEPWLEIMPREATKAAALQKLKAMLGCTRAVVFGDGRNDLPLFDAADESYATANADEEVKRAATAVIDSCDADGVARFMARRILR